VFASGLTVQIMLGVGAYVVIEAIGRIGEPEVQTGAMLVVGGIGLAVNIVSMVLLRDGSSESSTSREPTSRSSPTPPAASASSSPA
jgi:cobalt-zinc-cadmium efflux system protein